MALPTTSKKVFTTLAFQSGATLHRSKLHELTTTEIGNLTTPVAGELAYGGDTHLKLYDGSNWQNIHRTGVALSTGSVFTSTLASDSGNAPPFVVASTDKVLNLNADQVDGSNTSNAVGNNTIPVRDSSSLFHVGATSYYTGTDFTAFDAVTATQVANKALVDAAVAKLVNSAPAALDTLEELAGALGDDANFSSNVTTSLSNRLVISSAVTYTATQQGHGRSNLGLGALATLSAVGASEITDGSVDTAELADDAVDADKLDSSASFLMGRLGIGAGNSSGGALGIQHGAANQVNITHDGADTNEWGLLLGHGNGSASGTYHGLDNAAVINVSNAPLHLGTNNAAIMTLASGKVLVGRTDTPSSVTPSGTLHISTARYGSELFDAAARVFTSGTYGWVVYGSNSIANVSNKLAITYSNNAFGAYVQLKAVSDLSADLVVGRRYRLTVDAYYTGGSSGAKIQVGLAGSNIDSDALTTSSATYTINFTADTATCAVVRTSGMGTGNVVTIDNLSLVEDTLTTAGTLSVNSAADDLVITNNDDAGISVLSPKTKKGSIYFGDKDGNNRGVISFDHSTDNLIFGLGGDGGGNYSLIIDNSRIAKFTSGIGSGGILAPANGAYFGGDGYKAIERVTGTASNAAVYIQKSGTGWQSNGNDIVAAFKYNATAGTANSGSNILEIGSQVVALTPVAGVAIGGTTANSPLTVHGGSHDAATIEITNSANSNARLLLNSGHGNWSVCNSDTLADALEFRDESANSTRLLIDNSGTQDHKGNSIVNSASIAGLQDGGACYFFNGSSSYITFDSFAGALATNDAFTISIWFKSPSGLSVASNSQILISAHSSGNSNRLRIGVDANSATATGIFYSDGQSGDATLGSQKYQDDEWHHLVVSRPSGANAQTAKFYVDGVQIATDDIGPTFNDVAKWSIGQEYDGGASDFFDGSIRDVKIFPSELDAADVRKLYSGENPKKNLNVELWANSEDWDGASGGTQPQSWTEANAGNWTLSSGGTGGTNILQITRSSDNPYMYQTQTVVVGKYYLIQARLQNGTASEVEVGMGSTNIGTQYGTFDHSSTSWTTHEKVIKATTTTLSIYVQVQTSSGSQYGYVDFVRVREVGTLVEFNPQSASSTKWRNEAILGFYDGTVNNATLSQGNTYWNNIKQDATDTTVSGELTVVPTASEKGVTIGDGTKGEVPLIFKGGSGSHSIGQNGGNFFISETGTGNLDSSARLSTDGQNVKIHNKLGVGTSADASHHLLVGGTARIEYAGGAASGLAIVGSSNRSKIAIVDNDTTAYVIAENDYISVGGNDSLNAANLNIHKTSGNVAIGATAAAQKFQVDGNIQLTNTAQTSSNFATNNQSIIFGDEQTGTSARHQASINAVREAWSNSPCKLTFKTSADVNSATTKLEIASDGTQDHKGNRIVNSQTINDSWRSSEPSLRFDGSNDVVTIGSTTNYGSKATVAVWVKFNKLDATDNGREGIVGSKYWSNNDFSLHLHDDGRIWFTSASAVYSNWNTTDLTIGTWVHLCLVWDTTQGTTANKAKLYINGAIQTQHSAGNHAGDLKTDTGLKIGKTEDTHDGEIKDVRLHNRAMEADEVKGLYNGESTPWKYADAGTELISNGDFSDTSSWTLHQGTNATTSFGSGVLTISNSSSSTAFTGADQSITVVKDKIYRLKLDVTVNNGAIYVRDIQNTILLYTNEAMDSGGSETPTISSTVTGQIYYFKAVASGTFTLRISRSTANGNTISVNVDNVSIQQIGEVAAYTPKSINDKWYDETSNANHGTITGATTVGNTKHLGPLHIKGKTTAGIILENTTNAQNANIDYYNNVGSVQSRIAYAEGTGAFTFVPNVSGLASGTLRLEHGNASGGAVTATSATSTTLRQVARTATDTIDGDGTAVAFEVNHQLGTKFVTVSVREKLNGGGQSFAYVDTEIRGGAWADPNGAVHTMQAISEESHITVIFATAPASGKDYYVTCVGA